MSQRAIDEFWRWFVVHQDDLRQISANRDTWYPQVIEKLRAIEAGLVCDFEVAEDKREGAIIISADGRKVLFPLVMRVATAAPKELLHDWQVIAFRQPRLQHFNLQFVDFTVSSDHVMVALGKVQLNKIAVTLYIKDWDESLPGAEAAGLVLLDNAVGEYETEMHIGKIKVKPWLPSGQVHEDWIPLIRLHRVLHELFGRD